MKALFLQHILVAYAFFLLPTLAAQPELSLKSGEQLSELSRYGQSNAQLEAFIQANPTRLYDQSEAWLLISYNLMQLGDFRGALQANERSLAIKAQLHADDLVQNYVRFGAIHLLRGRYQTALDYLLKAQELPIESIQLYAVIEGQLAAAYRGLQQYEQAETYYRQATETLLIEYPDNHPEVITSFYQLGKLYLEWNRPQEARRYFEQGLQRGSPFSEQRFLAGWLHDGLGQTYVREGDPRAEQHYSQALNIFLSTFGNFHRETAQIHLRLAQWYEQQGRPAEARRATLQAIRCLLPDASGLDWETLPANLDLVIDRPLLVEALGMRARLLLRADHIPDWILALANAELAATLADEALHVLADHADRFQVLAIAKAAIEPGIRAAIQLGDLPAKERAFLLADHWRLLDLRVQLPRPVTLKNEFAQQEQLLRQALASAELALRLRPNDLAVRQSVQAQRHAYQRLQSSWLQADRYTYQREFGVPAATLPTIREKLNKRTALISYWMMSDQAYVFGLSKRDILLMKLSPSSSALSMDLTKAIEQHRSAITDGRATEFANLGAAMYRQFVAPLKNWLEDMEELVILPDGPLRGLLFETLLTHPPKSGKASQYHKLPYLLHDYAISYHLAAQLLAADPPSFPRVGGTELAIFVPRFDQASASVVSPEISSWTDTPSSWVSTRAARPIPPLATSGLGAIARNFRRAGGKVSDLRGDTATVPALLTALRRASYAHLLTYSLSSQRNPEQSAMLASHKEGDLLGALSLQACLDAGPLSVKLITLAHPVDAANPATQELLHLPICGSWWLAGVPAGLYAVNLESSTDLSPALFPAFYQQLASGIPAQSAWYAARRELIAKKATANPRYWSGYVLLGY